MALHRLGVAQRNLGTLEGARTHLRAALVLREELEDREGTAETSYVLGGVLFDLGRYEGARERLGRGLGIYRDLGSREWEADCMRAL